METSKPTSLSAKIVQGSSAGILTTGVHLISRLLLIPVILHFVSLAHYGLWSLCFIILSYFGMSAFGIQNAYIRYGAHYTKQGNLSSLNALMSTGLTLMGTASLVFFLALFFGLTMIMGALGVDPDKMELARFMILGTAVAFLTEVWLGAFKGLLEGMQEIALIRMVWLSATLLEVILVVVFLMFGLGIKGVMYAYVLKTFWEVLIDMGLAFRKLPGLRVRPMLRREAFEALFVFGGKVQLLGLVGIFLGSYDRLVTTALVGLAATGLFEVGRKLPFTARGVAGAALSPFLPAASALEHIWEQSPWPSKKERALKYAALCLLPVVCSALLIVFWCLFRVLSSPWVWTSPYVWTGVLCLLILLGPGIWLARNWGRLVPGVEYLRADELKQLYLNGSRNMVLINGVIYCFILAAATELLQAWVGPGYEEAVFITRIIGLSTFVHLSTGVGTSIFKGLNRVGRELEYTLIQLVLALIWIPVLAWQFGLYGAVVGQAASVIPGSIFFLFRSNRAFRISQGDFARRLVAPLAVPGLAAIGVFVVLQMLPPLSRWATLGEILVIGCVYVTLTVWGMKKWVLSDREWQRLKGVLPWRRR